MAVQNGYFLIADITGYTQYLSVSELEHAQQILTALLNTVIRQTKAPLVISRLAGDAVISYGLSDRFVAGQTFAEMIEDTYIGFRKQIELMVRNTTCTCRACQNIAGLDLKFFVHHGPFSIQKLDRHDELVGSDVNLIHRLLKNTVTERTGLRAYTLFTEAALMALGLGDDAPTLLTHTESYEHLGEVKVFVKDMHAVWTARQDEIVVRVAPEDTQLMFETLIRAPPEMVWNNIIQPEHFNVLLGGDRMGLSGRLGGRVGPGSVYQCYHGDGVIANTVVGWRPFEVITLQFLLPIPIAKVTVLAEVELAPHAEGTQVIERFSKSRGSLIGRVAGDTAIKGLDGRLRGLLAGFKAHVEAEAAAVASGVTQAEVSTEEISAAALASAKSALAAGQPTS